jgi:hypothetical protein
VLKTRTGICVPPEAPAYAGPEQPIAIETERATFDMPLIELETLLSPAMFLLSGRDGVIVPIRREFAEFLFGPSRQIPLLAGPQAALLRERTYFCSMRAERSIRVGMPIVFYESGKAGGLGAATVIARVIRTERVWKDNIADDLHRRGVLTPHTMSRMGSKPYLLATTFDNITVFGRAVSLTRLRRLGCVSGANLVTATPVSAGQVEAICEEGRP